LRRSGWDPCLAAAFDAAKGERIPFDRYFTVDEVVFAEKGDLLLLGARTLEGLSLSVDPRKKKLVASGPIPVA
jgi:predicted aspartyl protease